MDCAAASFTQGKCAADRHLRDNLNTVTCATLVCDQSECCEDNGTCETQSAQTCAADQSVIPAKKDEKCPNSPSTNLCLTATCCQVTCSLIMLQIMFEYISLHCMRA